MTAPVSGLALAFAQGWAIALWVGVLLVITRRRIRWAVRTVLSPDRLPDMGRCGVHTTGWR